MSEKKKHHYIPASYLAGFTKEWERTSSFWAIPKDHSKPYGTKPDDACAERNYYRINSLTGDPLKVEDWYAETLESDIARVLKIIREKSALPEPYEMEFLIVLVATLYLRTPSFRATIASPLERSAEIYMSMLADSKSLYESCSTRALKKGYIREIHAHEKFKQQVKNGNIVAKANKDFLIKKEIDMILKVANMLAYRKWSLFTVPDCENYELVTSDDPFVLTHPEASSGIYYGLGTKNTEIIVPLNKRSLLLGVLEEGDNAAYEANEPLIGLANVKIAMSCNRVFYTSKETVTFFDGSEIWSHNIHETTTRDVFCNPVTHVL